ncbi:MAG: hypothetical protein L6Q37_09805 [Bdellovibrionaceae bacterium]|nr:hypothetical protein [Pseudobdellovibrionaceae bacterium]NUM57509.1 hypothetical protein [Pseudobdellovibrionaceae bacterium]
MKILLSIVFLSFHFASAVGVISHDDYIKEAASTFLVAGTAVLCGNLGESLSPDNQNQNRISVDRLGTVNSNLSDFANKVRTKFKISSIKIERTSRTQSISCLIIERVSLK